MALEAGQWWEVVTTVGSAASLHNRPLPDAPRRVVWAHSVTGPALVLGSSQPDHHVDRARATDTGVEVCRRRSGGGAVLVRPDDTWIDVVIGPDDPHWSEDVALAFLWLGEVWRRALAAAGIDRTSIHTSSLTEREASAVVCFAGRGPGEVVGPDGTKIVGMSQRRTRTAARFQTMVPYRQPLADTLDLLAPGVGGAIDPLAPIGATADPAVLTTLFLTELHR